MGYMLIPTAAQVIAMTLYLEAGNQGEEGIKAVASVIWLSSKDKTYVSLREECLKPKRYSCWNGRQPSVEIIRDEILQGKWYGVKTAVALSWQTCMSVACDMVQGKFEPTIEATNYCRHDVKPSWSNSMDVVCTIRDHIFYRS
jgi:hypothetical protein